MAPIATRRAGAISFRLDALSRPRRDDPDALAVTQAFDLAAHEVPVILVTAGYPASGNWPQKLRRPLHEVLAFA